jgi:hypothetical protein
VTSAGARQERFTSHCNFNGLTTYSSVARPLDRWGRLEAAVRRGSIEGAAAAAACGLMESLDNWLPLA